MYAIDLRNIEVLIDTQIFWTLKFMSLIELGYIEVFYDAFL